MKKCRTIIKKINNCFDHKIKITDEIVNHFKECKECYDYYLTYSDLLDNLKKQFKEKVKEFDFVSFNPKISEKSKTKKNKFILVSIMVPFLVIFILFFVFYKTDFRLEKKYYSSVSKEIINDFSFDNIDNFLISSYEDWFSTSIVEEIFVEDTLTLNQ